MEDRVEKPKAAKTKPPSCEGPKKNIVRKVLAETLQKKKTTDTIDSKEKGKQTAGQKKKKKAPGVLPLGLGTQGVSVTLPSREMAPLACLNVVVLA